MGEHGPIDPASPDVSHETGAAQPNGAAASPAPAPGKRLRTQLLRMSREAIQRRALARGTATPSADGGTTSAATDAGGAAAYDDPFAVHLAAERGTAGPAQGLPHQEAIQASFGRHDVGGIGAHVGGAAAEAAHAMGAVAFATGDQVAFAGAPDLHTAAHEAAHVVQQRAGVHLKGGVGEEGDAHERHADLVADRVVAGRSAEDLLDRYAGGGSGAAASAPVQGKVIQRAVKAKKESAETATDCATIAEILDVFGYKGTNKPLYVKRMKALLWNAGVVPQAYKDAFNNNDELKQEVYELCTTGLDDLVGACNSQTIITPTDGTDLANKLWALIGGSVNTAYLESKSPAAEMLGTGNGLQGDRAGSYLAYYNATRTKLRAYKAQLVEYPVRKEEIDKNKDLNARIDRLTELMTPLEEELSGALTGNKDKETGEAIKKLKKLGEEVEQIDKAITLEGKAYTDAIDTKVTNIQNDQTAHNSYRPNEGVEDGANVGDEYKVGMACSLFALLAVKPGFMGAGSPEELHTILRRTEKMQQYDEDAMSARIRFTAGLKPTMQGGAKLGDIITGILQTGKHPNFICDPTGKAHTFAVVWQDGGYHPKDNGESDNSVDIMKDDKWQKKRIGTTWQE